jgi:hypothetical protein
VGKEIVNRTAYISLCNGEVFYLQALLLHNAAYNYEELRTVNNITYDTFHEATMQLCFFANVDKVENCLQVAIAFYYTPYHLQFLHAQQIVDIPAPGLELREKYKDELSADHIEQFAPADQRYMEALRDMEHLLTTCGSNLSNFGLPEPGQRINQLDIERETFSPRIDIILHTAQDM